MKQGTTLSFCPKLCGAPFVFERFHLMKKKTIVKIILDAAMLVTLALLYNKSAISMAFHEIAGLCLIGALVIHLALNGRWLVNVTRKFFSKASSARTRFLYLLNFFLLISFLSVGVSGIAISKVVFAEVLPNASVSEKQSDTAAAPANSGAAAADQTTVSGESSQTGAPAGGHSNSSQIWKTVHYTGAALTLILAGIHLGMHYKYLTGIFRRWIYMPGLPGRAVAAVLVTVLLVTGVYSMATTSFTRWLTMPFSTSQSAGLGGEQKQGISIPGGHADTQSKSEAFSAPADSGQNSSGSTAKEKPSAGRGQQQKGGFLSAAKTFIQYGSISFVFAAVTVGVSKLFGKKKKQLTT